MSEDEDIQMFTWTNTQPRDDRMIAALTRLGVRPRSEMPEDERSQWVWCVNDGDGGTIDFDFADIIDRALDVAEQITGRGQA